MADRAVLIVDDDIALRDSLNDILREEGYATLCAGSCAEALEVARIHDFGAAVLDIKLPDGSGTTLLSDLKKLKPECVCAMVTAYADLDSAISALNQGAYQYLQKPVRPLELINLLERVFDTIQLREEKRRAEERLRESQERFRAVFEKARDAIFMKDRDSRYVMVNPSAERLFGISISELIGRTDAELFGEDVAGVLKAFDDRVLSGEVVEEEYTALNDQHPRTMHVIGVPMRDESGKAAGICGIGRDITERRKLEAQLFQAQKMEAIGTLAGGIAHDFNNILGAIMGYTELAKLELSQGSPSNTYLEEMLKATKRARDLVKQILAFSRQDEQEAGPVLLAPIVKECLNLLRATLPSTIEIHRDIQNEDVSVNANPVQIHQVLMNLATNAAHAMGGRAGSLFFGLKGIDVQGRIASDQGVLVPGPYAVFTVRDTGCGMDEQTTKRIFDPYFSTKEKGVGTGLGLAVVHGVVAKLGGTITVESALGKGTEFRIFLPRVETESHSGKDTGASIPEGRERLLFVDDEKTLAEIAEAMLRRLGYGVTTTTSPFEALDLFQKDPRRFDMVITDQTMPKMTGDQLARKLLEIRPDLPIVICTGFSEQMSREKAVALGVKFYVMKPLVMRTFAETIRKAFDKD